MGRRKPSDKIVYRKSKLPNPDGARRHTRQRAEERFELKLSRRDQTRLIAMIGKGQGQLLDRQDDERQVWLLDWRGERLPVVYEPNGKLVLTVLPADHPSVAGHIASPVPAVKRDPRLTPLKEVARDLGLPDSKGPIRIGAVARHDPTGLEGTVLDADMTSRILSIRVGETGQLRDFIRCFSGPALG